MKQYEAVIEVMRQNGGYASLGYLYQEALKIPGVTWNTKTPFKSINRIVQTHDIFFKVKPGLWALEEYRNRLPVEVSALIGLSAKNHSPQNLDIYNHSYYQGLLIEIGNLEDYKTYIPSQDKNRRFMNKSLGELATVQKIFDFAHADVVRRAKTIDVIWFNQRKMPAKVFEVEHSTDMQNSLAKFVELQDFNVEFVIVADEMRKGLFEHKITFQAYQSIQPRIKFLSYERLADLHAKTVAYVESKKRSGI